MIRRRITQTNYQKIKKCKVYSSSRDNIWIDDLADMQLISKYSKGIRFLSFVIDNLNKYTWVVPLIDEKGIKFEMSLVVNQREYG